MRVTVSDGTFANFVSRPRPMEFSGAAVVLLHEIYGVNADVRSICEELAAQGFLAIAPDLFWREQPGVDVSLSDEHDWQRRMDIYARYDFDRGIRDVAATIRSARTVGGATGRIGVMGFGPGGLLSYLAAARLPIDAAVAYYGQKIEQHLDEAHNVAVPLMIHLGEEDPLIPQAAQSEIRAALGAKDNVVIWGYSGCGHAFATHTGSQYHAEAAAVANERTFAFFERHLTP